MYDTERQQRFAALTSKATKQLVKGPDYRTKGLSKKNLHDSVLEGVFTGIDAVMDGLAKEISRIISGPSTKRQDEVAESFQLALASVRQLMGVGDVKAGTASWVAYATAGIPQPRKSLQGIEGWDGVFTSEEEAEEKSTEEFFWITKARERAGANPDRDKYLAEARALMESDPEDEVIAEVLDLAAELWPGKSKKDLAEMIQYKEA